MGMKPRTAGGARLALAEVELAKSPASFAAQARRFLKMGLPWEVIEGLNDQARVWRLPTPNLLVDGDLKIQGTLEVGTGEHDGGFLIVLGDVHCGNFVVQSGFTFLCTGSLVAKESIIATSGDSVTCVGGAVTAHFLDSGSGAWLTIYEPTSLNVEHLAGYVMVEGRPLRGAGQADIATLLKPEVIEREEWASLDPEEREGESEADYIRVDDSAARRILARGGTILR